MHTILVVGGTRRDNHNDSSWIIESLGRLTEKLLESKLRSRSFSYIIKKKHLAPTKQSLRRRSEKDYPYSAIAVSEHQAAIVDRSSFGVRIIVIITIGMTIFAPKIGAHAERMISHY